MSKFTTKFSTPLIRLLLIDPLLPEKVRNSTTTELIQWINEIGLEDSAEIMAFASSQQIEAIFDIDLWAPQIKGGDEKFNPSRFGTWLEILTEININRAVDKIIEMDEEFISMAFSSLVWVAETSWLEGSFSSNSQIEKIIDSKLTFEIDNYLLFAKTEQNWDAFISIIIEMDSHHHSFLYSILERCANFMIQEARTGDELFDILNDEDQLIDDVTFEREKRRETQGFVTPSTARSFIKLCNLSLDVEDLVTPKHLLLKKLSSLDEAIINNSNSIAFNSKSKFKNVQTIFEKYPKQGNLFIEQINFLANILMSGWEWTSEERRPGRALEIVLEICEKGLIDSKEAFSSFPRAFRIGWKISQKN